MISQVLTIDTFNKITVHKTQNEKSIIEIHLNGETVFKGGLNTLYNVLWDNQPVTIPPVTQEEPFNHNTFYSKDEGAYIIYKVCLRPLSNLIPDTDWQPHYYNSWTEANEDYERGFNIGYSISLDKFRLDEIPTDPCFQTENDFIDYIHHNPSNVVNLERRNMFGRAIDQKSVIVVIDMDYNVVDIRRPFTTEQWEYNLINRNDDCHQRFLLHVTTDNTEEEILQDVYDNHIYPILSEEERANVNSQFYTVPLQRLIYRNFWGILKGDQ